MPPSVVWLVLSCEDKQKAVGTDDQSTNVPGTQVMADFDKSHPFLPQHLVWYVPFNHGWFSVVDRILLQCAKKNIQALQIPILYRAITLKTKNM